MYKLLVLFAFVLISVPFKAATLNGQIQGEGFKDLRVSLKRTQSPQKVNRKGRFSIKNVDLDSDTLFLYERSEKEPVAVFIGGLPKVSITSTDSLLTVVLRKEAKQPASVYDGTILMQSDLEAIGDPLTLNAVKVRFPQSPTTSLNGSMEPLYFIDGVMTNDISSVPVMETAYVEVVRPSNPSCTLFGSRGGNGLILLTTITKYKSTFTENDEAKERKITIHRVLRPNAASKK